MSTELANPDQLNIRLDGGDLFDNESIKEPCPEEIKISNHPSPPRSPPLPAAKSGYDIDYNNVDLNVNPFKSSGKMPGSPSIGVSKGSSALDEDFNPFKPRKRLSKSPPPVSPPVSSDANLSLNNNNNKVTDAVPKASVDPTTTSTTKPSPKPPVDPTKTAETASESSLDPLSTKKPAPKPSVDPTTVVETTPEPSVKPKTTKKSASKPSVDPVTTTETAVPVESVALVPEKDEATTVPVKQPVKYVNLVII